MWIDAHSHLTTLKTAQRAVSEACSAGISGWVQGGIDPEDWERQESLRAKASADPSLGKAAPGILTAFGLHPWWLTAQSPAVIAQGFELLEKRLPSAHAAGEMGLDLMDKYSHAKAIQIELFERQLELAKRLEKPLILHIVRAHPEATAILQSHAPFSRGGIIHAFSGSFEDAQAYVNMGFLISIGGGLLRKGYEKLKKTVRTLPGSHLVLETDTEEPILLLEIARHAGELRGETSKLILDRGTGHLKRLFNL